jgi:dihydroorotate dehydrogenase electron transfer subunit
MTIDPRMPNEGNAVVNTAHPGHYATTLIENRSLSERYYLLVLSRPEGFEDPGPGTFVHLLVPGGGRFFLRRPFSVLDCDDRTISLIVVEKGTGTQRMRRLAPGERMDLIGPMGASFPRVPGKRVLALAGGVGLAPLYFYWRRRHEDDCRSFRLLYGARTRDDLFIDRFDWDEDAVAFSSDDGSWGLRGNVVDLAERELSASPADVIFSCGPNPMLKAAAAFANRYRLPHFVSLENNMACALGACRSCVVLTRTNGDVLYRTVCKDGPVFDASVLVWEELPEI